MLPVTFENLWLQVDQNEELNWLHEQPAVKAVIKEYARERLLVVLGPWLASEVTEQNVIGAAMAVSMDMLTYGIPERMFVAIQESMTEDDDIDAPFSDDEPPDLDKTVSEAVDRYRKSGLKLTISEFVLMEPHIFLLMH